MYVVREEGRINVRTDETTGPNHEGTFTDRTPFCRRQDTKRSLSVYESLAST
jgi:hypothetical protein